MAKLCVCVCVLLLCVHGEFTEDPPLIFFFVIKSFKSISKYEYII